MPADEQVPRCPAGWEGCGMVRELLNLREECRRLRELTQTDPLTGLYNRRHFLMALEQEMERTRRTGLPTSLIMLDLDHFKLINDTLGHPYGDAILRQVAELLRKNIRRLDIPCRYGGEEFALILPATRLSQAVQLARRLRGLFPETFAGRRELRLPLTASFGVDCYTGRREMSAETFLHQADRWLLLAKAQGRNTVCYPGGPLGEPPGLSREERQGLLGRKVAAPDQVEKSYG